MGTFLLANITVIRYRVVFLKDWTTLVVGLTSFLVACKEASVCVTGTETTDSRVFFFTIVVSTSIIFKRLFFCARLHLELKFYLFVYLDLDLWGL